MPGPRRQDYHIPCLNVYLLAARAAQHELCGSCGEPEHLMRRRMVVMIAIDPISPLRWPAVSLKHRLD